jgi:hypothetical protein
MGSGEREHAPAGALSASLASLYESRACAESTTINAA